MMLLFITSCCNSTSDHLLVLDHIIDLLLLSWNESTFPDWDLVANVIQCHDPVTTPYDTCLIQNSSNLPLQDVCPFVNFIEQSFWQILHMIFNIGIKLFCYVQ